MDQFENILISTEGTLRSPFTIKFDDNGMISISGKDMSGIVDGLPHEKIKTLVCSRHAYAQ